MALFNFLALSLRLKGQGGVYRLAFLTALTRFSTPCPYLMWTGRNTQVAFLLQKEVQFSSDSIPEFWLSVGGWNQHHLKTSFGTGGRGSLLSFIWITATMIVTLFCTTAINSTASTGEEYAITFLGHKWVHVEGFHFSQDKGKATSEMTSILLDTGEGNKDQLGLIPFSSF